MFAFLAASSAWQWIANIGSSVLLTLALSPEPDPYANLGMVCIALVLVYALYQLFVQVRRLIIVLRKQREV
ncbi:MAG: hypothetical protein Q9M26_06680 [Mariprofundales bacterium]|nr:hypothetical protein [Mariprofundales bacterium]